MYVCNKVCVSFKEITTKRKTETEHCKKNIIWHLCRTVVYIFKLLFFYYINITNSYSNFQQIQILSLQMKLTPPLSLYLDLDYVCIYVICKNAIILKCTCACTFQEIAKRKYSKYSKSKTFYFCYIIKKEYKLTTNEWFD